MANILDSIKSKLHEIEKQENVRIIMAVESGSRAWGFESPDSDYDVRFIYVRRPEDYLKLMPMRDVIEWQLDDVYDISGWDLRKALILLHDSNPTLHEWCGSPIVYRNSETADRFRELTKDHFLPKKALFHYVSMANRAYEGYLKGDEVRLKKYFYALRPILAAKWVAERKTAPPMMFDELVEAELPCNLLGNVQDLLDKKKGAPELGVSPKVPELDLYITEQLDVLREIAEKEENSKNTWEKLDAFFLETVDGSGSTYSW